MKKFYVTTPIYYVNDKPHIGHAYTTIAADVIARYYKIKLDEKRVFFLTGTDEHGAKIAEAAGMNNKSPEKFCDELIPKFKLAWNNLNIDYDYFIRTTNKKHIKFVKNILRKIYENGDIYKDTYSGYYCVGCEKYLIKADLVNGRCKLHPNKKPIKQKEENYFFKLSKYQTKLLKALDKGEYQILPKSRHNEVYNKIKKGLDDVSLSRQEVTWGIPVPWDKKQTIYVWFDALLNYYSGPQIYSKTPPKDTQWFPADVHLMAKDILWFHGVIWPAMLLSAGLPLPKTIFAHGYFTINGQKMSKSLGNVIDPNKLVEKYGADAVRHYLLSAFPFGVDGNVSIKDLEEKYNNELANGLGNLVSRVSHLCEKYDIQVQEKQEVLEKCLQIKPGVIWKEIENYKFDRAIKNIFQIVNSANSYVEKTKPWEIAKTDPKKLEIILKDLVVCIRQIAFFLKPIMPKTADIIDKEFSKTKLRKVRPLFIKIKD